MILSEAKSDQVKWFVITVMLAGLVLPFVLFKSSYPFYRFGMFAEPVIGADRPKKEELFYATFQKNGVEKMFDPVEFGMPMSQWEALSRNYYYQQRTEEFLSVLKPLHSEAQGWKLFQVVITSQEKDTLQVFP